jgi:hypothetical protein
MQMQKALLAGAGVILCALWIVAIVKTSSRNEPGVHATVLLSSGKNVLIVPGNLKITGPIPMFGKSALLFSESIYGTAYLMHYQKGEMEKIGILLSPPICMLPVDGSLKAKILEYRPGATGEGPSFVELDPIARPAGWKQSTWDQWRRCWVLNSHMAPIE